MISIIEHFHVPIGHLYSFFWKMSILVLCLFFFLIGLFVLLILSFMSCYIFWILTLYESYHLKNTFSHSVSFLFFLPVVSFAVQKRLSLIRFHLFIFAFVSFPLRLIQTILLWFMSKIVLPMFSSRIFMISDLIFWSLSWGNFSILCWRMF